MRKVPKKARRALRKLAKMPPARNRRDHVARVHFATERYYSK